MDIQHSMDNGSMDWIVKFIYPWKTLIVLGKDVCVTVFSPFAPACWRSGIHEATGGGLGLRSSVVEFRVQDALPWRW